MVKGAQKQMIVIKTGDSRYFDEAYFVLRREVRARGARRDMLAEANKILEECGAQSKERRRHLPHALLLFAGGLLCGAVPTVALFLLLL